MANGNGTKRHDTPSSPRTAELPQVRAADKDCRTAVGEHGRAAELHHDPLG